MSGNPTSSTATSGSVSWISRNASAAVLAPPAHTMSSEASMSALAPAITTGWSSTMTTRIGVLDICPHYITCLSACVIGLVDWDHCNDARAFAHLLANLEASANLGHPVPHTRDSVAWLHTGTRAFWGGLRQTVIFAFKRQHPTPELRFEVKTDIDL